MPMHPLDEQTPYQNLTPDTILDAVEGAGYPCTGALSALNSFENRVYQIGVEGSSPLVAKFYRAGRWSDAAIQEEHRFCQLLAAQELPVVAPLVGADRQTLFHHRGYRFALYPRQGGRAPELENLANLEQLGRFLGRMHAAGASRPYRHRLQLDGANWGVTSARQVLASGRLSESWRPRYQALTTNLIDIIKITFQEAGRLRPIRLHGDCHPGNILWTPTGPFFVDFDDTCMGPAIQDLWMCLSGERAERTLQMSHLLQGYRMFFDFNRAELALIEPLRTLRMLHHAAWIARRWADPAFPQAFPWFNGPRYWEEHIHALQEQVELLAESPLDIVW
ncbi:MAG: serine/threonine protein kinase [Magnetococcus sp. MYC-9]